MPIEIQEGYQIIIDTISKKKFHKHYNRVTELADLYKKLITGDKMDTLLRRFARREDEALFAQRVSLTQAITPAISSGLKTPFHKVGRVNSIVKKIDFKNTKDFDNKKALLEETILTFNGDKSLDRYLETRFTDLNFTDPNSFIITEFDAVPLGPQGEMTTKVQPRPFECSSTQAVNYFYKNNILKWLIVRLDISYKLLDKDQAGFSYTIYLEDNAIKLTQIDPKNVNVVEGVLTSIPTLEGDKTYYRVSENELYIIEEFEYNAGKIPAIRVGYKLDLVTNGETCVSPMQDAMPYMMKSIKSVSEFDLTMCLHAFPQKFQYAPRCAGDVRMKIACDSGRTPDGAICGSCGGSGLYIHTTAQDAISMRMPKNPDEVIDLQKLVHYEYPPIPLLEFQDKNITQLKNECRQAVFNSEIFSKTEITATATEMRISLDSVYDTLFPFAEHFSRVYKHEVEMIAIFIDIPDVIVEHRFPKDFKFKSVSDLLNELDIANRSNAPGYVREELSMDIAEQQFIDKPEELNRIKVKQRFFPFPDKTPTEIIYIVSNNKTSEANEILWANFDNIFLQLEADAEQFNQYFYDYTYQKQKQLLDVKVKSIIEEIKGEIPAAIELPKEDLEIDE